MGQRARRAGGRRGRPVAAFRIVAVGRAPPAGPERALFERYVARMRPPPALTELADGTGAPDEIRRREGDAILAALGPRRVTVVALDGRGTESSSDRLAAAYRDWIATGRDLAFVLGGAEGLDRRVLERADRLLSLGAATWPHLLARAMLVEQLYRAQTILAGHPYHRA